jgi:hypothetical protein
MTESFDLILSKSLPVEVVRAILADLLPGLRVDVLSPGEQFPDDPGDVLVQLKPTLDQNWPLALDVLIFPVPSPIGQLPALTLTEAISSRGGANVLTDLHGLFPELDPHDPYWWLVYAEGRWSLADAADTPLMGPYTDGQRTFPGDGVVKLVRTVDPWSPSRA